MQIRKMAFHNAIALFFHEPSSANVEPSRLNSQSALPRTSRDIFLLFPSACACQAWCKHAGGCDLSPNFLRSRAA